MSDQLVSLIRTAVPAGVGALLAWLAAELGIVLDESSSTALTTGTAALAGAAYYAGVRALEERWPWVGVLLGVRSTPAYGQPPAETQSEYEYDPTTGQVRVIRSVTTYPTR